MNEKISQKIKDQILSQVSSKCAWSGVNLNLFSKRGLQVKKKEEIMAENMCCNPLIGYNKFRARLQQILMWGLG